MNQMAPPGPAKAVKTRMRVPKALGIRNFRIYFTGTAISVPGTWMQLTAQAWLVLNLTNSPVALAIVTSLQFLPIFVFSLIGGAMADRFPRQKLMFATMSMGGLQAAVLGVLCLTGHIQIWHIYILAVTLGIINALDAPLRQTFISELVPVSHLPNAIAMGSLAQNLGRIIGPALGGLVIAALGVGIAYLINALTFVAAVTALAMLRRDEFQPQRKSGKQPLLLQVREGIGYARRTPTILFLLIATAFIGLFGQNFTTMVPLISTYLVHADAAAFGVLNSCLGTGSFLAALVMTTRGAPSTRRILLAGTCFGIVLVAISFSSSLPLSAILFVAVGASAVTFSASVNTLLQLRAPPEMRGRLVSMISLLIPSPIGPLLTGAAASAFGVGWAVLGNGLLCCLGIGLAYAYLLKHRSSGTYSEFVAPQDEPELAEAQLDTAERGIK
ncbi:MAG: MFS transporter [Candidatus Devosia phytovorans]|uniref:MFS transporter n=1 Tax=Candidatus Devosia phytovorans TaxID=3121372 RepID=A0AAJ6B0K0_9HYPH|nr:MFS transporter [Devosia sp.]WEK05287.1 MAG: MFS transporter [Devosia sp.]